MNKAKSIAASLLDIKAVSITSRDNLFTWVSGIKSPIYCDNRKTISYPEVRNAIASQFADIVKEKYSDADVIAGTATAGIPHAAWVADKLNKPMVYVRSKPKGHGQGNQIEGDLVAGQKVVLIEDLLSTGGSSLEAVTALKEAGVEVLVVLAIFSYKFPIVDERFEAAGVAYETLTDYTVLLPLAVEMGYVKKEDQEALLEWSKNPRMFTEE